MRSKAVIKTQPHISSEST